MALNRIRLISNSFEYTYIMTKKDYFSALLAALREQKQMGLKGGIVPFIITDELKLFYYRGLREWGHINDNLIETCLTAQDQYKTALDYFRIKY